MAITGPYAQRVVADGAVAYWRLGETSGTTANSEVGSFPGTISGGVTLNQPGAVPGDGAMAFDGSTGQINLGSVAALNIVGDVTLEAWIKKTGAGVYSGIISSQQTTTVNIPYEFRLTSDSPPFVQFVHASGSGQETLTSTTTVSDNNYHHVVVTRSGTSIRFYIDGVPAGVLTSTVVPTATSAVAYIARRNGGGTFFPGTLDDVAIYPTALTAPQILAHYQLSSGAVAFDGRVPLVANVWAALTPSDAVDAPPLDAIWVGQGGDLAIQHSDGRIAIIPGIPSNTTLPLAAKRVRATATTATNLMALRQV